MAGRGATEEGLGVEEEWFGQEVVKEEDTHCKLQEMGLICAEPVVTNNSEADISASIISISKPVTNSSSLIIVNDVDAIVKNMIEQTTAQGDIIQDTLKSFKIQGSLKLDIPKEPFKCKCNKCGEKFLKRINMRHHLKYHHRKFPYKCEAYKCDASYGTYAGARTHMKKVHPELTSLIKCLKCDEIFSRIHAMKKHLAHHGKHLYFKCSAQGCDASYGTNSAATKHTKKGHIVGKDINSEISELPDGGNMCSRCGNKFTTYYSARKHMIYHNGDGRPLKCKEETCDKTFRDKSSLTRHSWHFHREYMMRAMGCAGGRAFTLKQKKEQYLAKLNKEHVLANEFLAAYNREKRKSNTIQVFHKDAFKKTTIGQVAMCPELDKPDAPLNLLESTEHEEQKEILRDDGKSIKVELEEGEMPSKSKVEPEEGELLAEPGKHNSYFCLSTLSKTAGQEFYLIPTEDIPKDNNYLMKSDNILDREDAIKKIHKDWAELW